ncbi:MAG: type II secretion system protein [Puniceicoccales bacterium]
MYTPRRAFSLIELLSVIAIIALLAGIIIPIIGRVRQHSHSVECSNNLRQVAMAIHLYGQDNNGALPGPLLGGQLADYKMGTGQISGFIREYGDFELTNETSPKIKALICPGSDELIEGDTPRYYSTRQTYVQTLSNDRAIPFGRPNGDPSKTAQAVRIMNILDPQSEWMMRDIDAIGAASYAGNDNVCQQIAHGDFRNVSFFDGHVEAVPVNEK